MSLLARALCIRTVSRQAVRDNGSARDNAVKAAVLCSTDLGMDGLKRSDSIDGAADFPQVPNQPYQSDLEGKSAESPERTEIDWRLDIADPTSSGDGPVESQP